MRRRLFTTAEFIAEGGTPDQLRWRVKHDRYARVDYRVYAEGSEEPDTFEKALGRMMATDTPAWGTVAGVLHQYDGVEVVDDTPKRRRTLPIDDTVVVVDGVRCTSPLQTIVDLAEFLEDLEWEQALESGLRRKRDERTGRRHPPQFLFEDLVALLPLMSKTRRHGAPRIRRVLELRGWDVPATDSLLETLMVQLIRTLLPDLPPPVRQYRVYDEHGQFVARVDLCWPEFGLFIELDGMHHPGQPVYDSSRETAVVAATGWLPGRFTWREVKYNQRHTARRLAKLVDQARRRPLATV